MVSDADPLSSAVTSPEASLSLRQILQAALGSAGVATASWAPQAQALLANLLMNDYFNSWNQPVDVNLAQNAVNEAMAAPGLSDPVSALAHHAQGLVLRAQGDQKSALASFEEARRLDPGFARAHAQAGNQKVRLGQEKNSHDDFQTARNLAPHHPASGYFDWGEGRACFQEQNWPQAIDLLMTSVETLGKVWYNRCYLAAAQEAAGDTAAAKQTKANLVNQLGASALARAINSLQPNASDPPTVAAARKRVLDFLQRP